jgi:YidC/Oxa1 family membrane protein insertase
MQALSVLLPQIWAKKRNRKATTVSEKGRKKLKTQKIVQYIMIVVICGVVCSSPTGVGIYWFLSSLFTIVQQFVVHMIIMNKRQKERSLQAKLGKLGL